jgi:hypothetical protein
MTGTRFAQYSTRPMTRMTDNIPFRTGLMLGPTFCLSVCLSRDKWRNRRKMADVAGARWRVGRWSTTLDYSARMWSPVLDIRRPTPALRKPTSKSSPSGPIRPRIMRADILSRCWPASCPWAIGIFFVKPTWSVSGLRRSARYKSLSTTSFGLTQSCHQVQSSAFGMNEGCLQIPKTPK